MKKDKYIERSTQLGLDIEKIVDNNDDDTSGFFCGFIRKLTE